MKSKQKRDLSNLCEIDTFSRKNNNYLIKRNSKHRKHRIKAFLLEAAATDLTPNFAVTIVWHALQTAGDRRDGHILGMPPDKRQEHLMRKLRTLAKKLGFSAVYVWVSSVGAKMGDHLHMALHWKYSAFLQLVDLFQNVLGSDVDHEGKTKGQFKARSFCRGWEITEIDDGLSGALRWGRYMAYQKSKHQDTSSGRRMGCSNINGISVNLNANGFLI